MGTEHFFEAVRDKDEAVVKKILTGQKIPKKALNSALWRMAENTSDDGRS
ncbi:MAG TPA: hypothetical protein PK358_12835 [Spirochaetota bacterium]|nr:hypothetical protein [Spirochaetota bacterium]HPJ35715.1 hypothetical protein [Spirochaetota bacterium]